MEKIRKATTKDVASLANVSQATVSMILNGREGASFSDETVRKVYEAAQQLGYQIKKKREDALGAQVRLIAVISPTLSNPYYTTLIQAIENEASTMGYSLLICNTHRDEQTERQYLDMIANSSLNGVIYTFMPCHGELVKLISARTPVVVVGDKNEAIDIDTVEINSEESGKILGDYLISLGHRRIAFISTPLNGNNVPRKRRLEGLRRTLKEAEDGTDLIVRESGTDTSASGGELNLESKIGYELAMDVLEKEDVTALVGVNDMVAYGILDALAESGKKVPEDYSVCGFDNIFPSAFDGVSLTTIDHFISFKGKDAVDILVKKMSTKTAALTPTSIFKVEYKPTLVIRHSTGPRRR